MELDFSKQIQEFFESSAKSSDEQLSFSRKIEDILIQKVKAHNEINEQEVSLQQLKKVYRRGQSSVSSGYRPGIARGQIAIARVNKFLKMLSEAKVCMDYLPFDEDIASNFEQYYIEQDGKAFANFKDIEFNLAKIDLVRGNVDPWDQDEDAEDLEYLEEERKTLNKPFKLFDSNKRYGVYVKSSKTGEIALIKFGNLNSEDEDTEKYSKNESLDKMTARYWGGKFWIKKAADETVSPEAVEWDEEGILSKWEWEDQSFASEEEILKENPNLQETKHIVEEEDF